MTSEDYKIVMFDIWCPKCKHRKVAEEDDPCRECLNYPVNEGNDQPVNYTESDKTRH